MGWGVTEDFKDRVRQVGAASRARLLAERNGSGWWEGELSSSALSTAVAVLALGSLPAGVMEEEMRDRLMLRGLEWLAATRGEDGGWGDTVRSRSNVATTLLGWSAFGMGSMRGVPGGWKAVEAGAEGWLERVAGGLGPEALGAALVKRYGKDKTFAVPIFMACAVGGRLGADPECWRRVPALPFELAAFPRKWFAALRLPVVSYALPALIAIGQARHVKAPLRGPWGWVRSAAMARTGRLLREIQPEGGGFLEATPLTGFVTMALCAAGAGTGDVVREAVAFLVKSVREDGSWPIDTNLATWGTTLSVKALGKSRLPGADRAAVRGWLLGQQYLERHAYCLSAPGGWAWTDLPGGVPDADDTAGALLALKELTDSDGAPESVRTGEARAAEAGAGWLMGLQNGDGGMPTFCKGWGALPFDRSAPDLTAHALAAWQTWRGEIALNAVPAMRRAVAWLGKTQRQDGAWLPLWFGNEHEPDENNPVYGTATVLKYLCVLPGSDFKELSGIRDRAAGFLWSVRRADGTWSGGSAREGAGSIEETAVALEALLECDRVRGEVGGTGDVRKPGNGEVFGPPFKETPNEAAKEMANEAAKEMVKETPKPMANDRHAKQPGAGWDANLVRESAEALMAMTREGTDFPAAPIGLYFARLWYYEKLYPMIAAVSAFRVLDRWIK
ncbi:MAG: shc 2 [Verrucomicrobiales bacterium]|nr:shc 2 [Verrucomicrobiales bacterium]